MTYTGEKSRLPSDFSEATFYIEEKEVTRSNSKMWAKDIKHIKKFK